MRTIISIGLTMLSVATSAWSAQAPAMSAPRAALEKLRAGNQRYVEEKFLHPNRTMESRHAVAAQQRPFAVILGCADSRVSPEIVFDQGIGDLFVVRVAGNVAGPLEWDSIEYAVTVLGVSVIVVLGHEGCGAVKAVVDNQISGIPAVAELIQSAVDTVRKSPGDLLANAVKANVRFTMKSILEHDDLGQRIRDGRLVLVGGYYHLRSGEVELLSSIVPAGVVNGAAR